MLGLLKRKQDVLPKQNGRESCIENITMTNKEFISISQKVFEKWLNYLNQLIRQGNLNIPGPYSFNNILRIAESPSHYICELMGAKKYRIQERIALVFHRNTEKFENTNSYFIPFSKQDNASATVRMLADDNSLSGIKITTDYDFQLVSANQLI